MSVAVPPPPPSTSEQPVVKPADPPTDSMMDTEVDVKHQIAENVAAPETGAALNREVVSAPDSAATEKVGCCNQIKYVL